MESSYVYGYNEGWTSDDLRNDRRRTKSKSTPRLMVRQTLYEETESEQSRHAMPSLYGGNHRHETSSFGQDKDDLSAFPDPLRFERDCFPPPQYCTRHPGVEFRSVSSYDKAHPVSEKEQKCPAMSLSREPPPTIEIAPGIFERLRGANETWACIQNDAYRPTQCMACCIDLLCILDANYVLCPGCKVISPLDGHDPNGDGGVGLGFTISDLQKWQCEIMARRRH